MKKIYVQPSVKEVKLNTSNLMQTASISEVTANPTEETTEMDSKHGLWSDYDDFDEE